MHDESLPELAPAAGGLATALVEYGYEHADSDLIGGQHDAAEIARRLQHWLDQRDPTDRVIVYWTGHGRIEPWGYFLIASNSPARGELLTGAADAYQANVLLHQVFNSPASHSLLIVDACFSGAALGEMAAELAKVRLATTTPVGSDRKIAVMTSAHALGTVPVAAFCSALQRLLVAELATGEENHRSWDDADQWIDLFPLRNALQDELGRDAHVDVVAYETAGWGLVSTDGRRWLVNPRFSGVRPAEVVEVLHRELGAVTSANVHFDLAARGIEVGSTAWYFTGRTTTLRTVVRFLEEADQGVMVVTGPPGAGKSAILSRIATLAVPGYRRLATESGALAGAPSATLPPLDVFDVAVHARAKTTVGVVRAIAAAPRLGFTDLDRDDVRSQELIDRLAERPGRFTVIVDAVDEAIAGHRVGIADLCRRLGSVASVRVLVGCRYHLDGSPLADGEDPTAGLRRRFGTEVRLVDVGNDPDTRADIAGYVEQRLSRSPHADHPDLARIAAAVADQAIAGEGFFLYARLVSRTLEASEGLTLDLPTSAIDAFHDDLFQRFGDDSARIDELLLPLAWGLGDGLPKQVWAWLATELSVTEAIYSSRDINWLLDTAGWHIVQATADDRAVYRLAHSLLAAHYQQSNDPVASHRRIVHRLAAGLSGESWLTADPYVSHHLPDHAAKAGLVGELVLDPWFLATSDVVSLRPAIRGLAATGDARAIGQLFRRIAGLVDGMHPGERVSFLHLTALQEVDGTGRHPLCRRLLPSPDATWRAEWTAWQRSTFHESLEGHTGWVLAVAIGQVDGRDVIVSSGNDRTIRVWDPRGEQPPTVLRGHTDWIWAVAVGRLSGRDVVVSAGDDRTVRIWDPTGDRAPVVLRGHGDRTRAVAIGELDGREVIVSGSNDGTVRIWDPTGERPSRVLPGPTGSVTSVALGRLSGRSVLVSAGHDRMVRLWDRAAGTRTLAGHTAAVYGVAIGRVGGRDVVVSAGNDHTVRVWDPATSRPPRVLRGHTDRVKAVAIGRVGGRDVVVSAGNDRTVRVWDPAGSGPPEVLEGHTDRVKAVSVGRAAGREVVVSGGHDRLVRVWEGGGHEDSVAVDGHRGVVRAIATCEVAGRTMLASGGSDHTVRMWDPTIGDHARLEGHGGEVWAVAMGRIEGRAVIVSGSDDRTVRIWDVADRRSISVRAGHRAEVRAVALGHHGERQVVVSAGNDRTVRITDAADPEQPATVLKGHTDRIRAVAIGRLDGRDVVVSAGHDQTVRVWDPAGGPALAVLTGHAGHIEAVALGRLNGTEVVVSGGADRVVRVWLAAGNRTAVIEGIDGGRIRAVAIGELGGHEAIVSAGHDRRLRIWAADGDTGLQARLTIPTTARVHGVALVPGGRIAIATSRGLSLYSVNLEPVQQT
ncbi:MAG: WD40 repeat domain-containing protein [Acidimicrobiales bacterium]